MQLITLYGSFAVYMLKHGDSFDETSPYNELCVNYRPLPFG